MPHELPDSIEHLVVLGRGLGHVVNDRRHVTKDGGIQQARDDHHYQTENLRTEMNIN